MFPLGQVCVCVGAGSLGMALALLGKAGPPDAPAAFVAACREAGVEVEAAPGTPRSPPRLDSDAVAAAEAASAAYIVELMTML